MSTLLKIISRCSLCLIMPALMTAVCLRAEEPRFAVRPSPQAGGNVEPAAFAQPDKGAMNNDINVGGGAAYRFVQDFGSISHALAAGAAGNGEMVVMADYGGNFYLLGDGRFNLLVGAGIIDAADGESPGPLFTLKLLGNAAFGIQYGFAAFRALPLNLSFEDVELQVNNDQVEARALIGSTVYLPISLLAAMEERNLFLGLTLGARVDSETPQALALQPKIRYLDDKISAEARYLGTVTGDFQEHKAAVHFGLNHLFGGRNNQLNAVLTNGIFTSPERTRHVVDGRIMFGGNF